MNYLTLYILTHNKSGLKYFGKTIKDLEYYHGSGTAWSLHCTEHGYDMTKEIVLRVPNTTENQDLIRITAQEFSRDNDIVNSDKWLNLINESGVAGDTHIDEEEFLKSIQNKGLKKVLKYRFNIDKSSMKMINKLQIDEIKSTLTRGPGTKITSDGTVVIRYDNTNRVNDVYDNLKWDLFRKTNAIKNGAKIVLIPINGLKEVGVSFTATSDLYEIKDNTNIWSKRNIVLD